MVEFRIVFLLLLFWLKVYREIDLMCQKLESKLFLLANDFKQVFNGMISACSVMQCSTLRIKKALY